MRLAPALNPEIVRRLIMSGAQNRVVFLSGLIAGSLLIAVTLILLPHVLDMIRKPQLLGMRLATLTPELQKSFGLVNAHGVVILDPGANHERLDIGALQPGDCFFHVGHASHNLPENVQSFARQLLDNSWLSEVDGRGYHRCKVAYEFKRSDSSGSNTQNILLSPQDLEELKRVAMTRLSDPTRELLREEKH